MAKPRVSVISVFFNRAEHVDDSVQSIVWQTYPNLEAILVDDGSTDETLHKLRQWEKTHANIKVVSHENIGFTPSIIAAVQQSEGEYIAIHGSGDISLPKRIQLQAQALDENPEIGVVGSLRKNVSADSSKVLGLLGESFCGDARHILLDRNLFTHGEVMFRRSAYNSVGGYRNFFVYAQDRDLWCRLSMITKFCVLDEVLYHRKRLPGSVSLSPEKRVAQSLYSGFALQSHACRINGTEKNDFEHGAASIAMTDPSSKLAERFFRHGVKSAIEQDFCSAYFYLVAAKRSGATFYGLAASFLLPLVRLLRSFSGRKSPTKP